jgi:cation:H+ antiporter
MDFSALPLGVVVAAFVGAAAVLVVLGSRFARVVDRIADRTGLGEAIAGAVLLGATTSLPGLITSIVAALEGQAGFAVSNSSGGSQRRPRFLRWPTWRTGV